mgnify:CR=1 FL=1
MEDVLSVYCRPYDPKRPMICMDERSYALRSEVRAPRRMKPGRAARYDHHYRRRGVMNVFMFFEPLAGRREVMLRAQRTKADWAYAMRALLTEQYPEAETVVVVMDNLNTHTPASFYEVFPPEEARRLVERLEIHYTPEHGSWLNMAEIELSVLTRQCLSRRIGEERMLVDEVMAWKEERNQQSATARWQFRNEEARMKLKHLYPKNEP